MTDFVLGSDHTRALDHFAGYGLAAVLEQHGENDLRLHWSEDAVPQLTITGLRSSPAEVATIVHAHASAHCEPASWVQQTVTVQRPTGPAEVGLFSPRIATPQDTAAWRELYARRCEVLDDTVNQSWLDSLMLQGLGEPAHWLLNTNTAEPDRGASRWEMQVRTNGADFTRSRLAKLAEKVSGRSLEGVLRGLTGADVRDEAGNNKNDSRTATGLVTPRAVDNALAWCALWGLSAFRLTHRVGRQSFTPGAHPQNRVHPEQMALPLVTQPTSPAKLRRLLRSRAFDDAAFAAAGSPERTVGREALRAACVSGIVRFGVRVTGSASAPERQVLAGAFEPV